jgi:nucleotide-binding universal stress UspA family protein
LPRKAVVVAAYEPLEALPFWGRPAAIVPDELIEEAGNEAARTAAEGAELANSAGFDATSMVHEDDRAWKAILMAAEEAGAGIIVLGSHGRGAVGSTVLGSRHDLRCTPCQSPRDDLPPRRRRLDGSELGG